MSTTVAMPSEASCCGVNCLGAGGSPSSSSFRLQHQDNDLDGVLVEGMKRLSFDELQREQEEMHGVCKDDFQEEPQVMDDLIKSLKEQLDCIKKGTAYETTETINKSYATNRDMFVIFLRGNRYQPKPAAKQMIRYYDLKQDLFGTESLARDITSKDLNATDMQILMEGSLQIANCTDRAGRMIAIGLPGLRKLRNQRSELRTTFLQCNYIIREASSRGCIIVSYNHHARGQGTVEQMKLALAMPCNIAGFHLVSDSKMQSKFSPVASIAMAMFPPRIRAKTKIHFGSHQECQYSLTSFGIPRHALPLNKNNEMNLAHHQHWFEKCKQKEEETARRLQRTNLPSVPSTTTPSAARLPTTSTASSENTTPKNNDVLCTGRKANGAGNEKLMAMAILHSEAYDMSSKKGRKAIMDSMVEEITKGGGRFLKPNKSSVGTKQWLEVPEKEIYEKLGQMFRNLRRRRAY